MWSYTSASPLYLQRKHKEKLLLLLLLLLLLFVYGRDVSHAWREETCTRSVAKNIRKRTLRRQCDDNIKKDVKSLGLDFVDWLHLTQDRDRWLAFVSTAVNPRVP